jgi:hypothetical protein
MLLAVDGETDGSLGTGEGFGGVLLDYVDLEAVGGLKGRLAVRA